MGEIATTVRIQDDETLEQVSVVATIDDPMINGVVVCNSDGSEI